MRKGWEIRKLGDLTTALNGLWVGKKPPFVNIAVIRNTNFTKDCRLDTTDIAYIDAEVKHFSTRKLQCGDIIIEKSGGSDKQPVGRPVLFNIPEGDFSFSNFTSTLRINDQREMLPSFLQKALWAFYRSGKTASLQSKTTGIRNLDFKSYLKLPIPVPSIQEQERIVAELDSLTSIIEKKKQQLEELDRLAQSIFYDMFGSVVENRGIPISIMSDVFSLITDGTHQTPTYTEDKTNGYKFLSAKDVVGGCIDWDNIKYIPASLHQELYKRLAPRRGDLLLCKNGTTGIAAVVETDEIFDIYVSLALLRPKEGFLPQYLLYAINNQETKRQFNASLKGVGVPNLHLGEIRKTRILTPPLDLQNEFAEKIKAIDKQKELVKRSIVETETLFNSRMDFWYN